jgi:hypothetical protein
VRPPLLPLVRPGVRTPPKPTRADVEALARAQISRAHSLEAELAVMARLFVILLRSPWHVRLVYAVRILFARPLHFPRANVDAVSGKQLVTAGGHEGVTLTATAPERAPRERGES